MAIVAKMRCDHAGKTKQEETEVITLQAVYSSDPSQENYKWSKATPSGQLTLYITNPDAQGQIKQGKEYWVTIAEVSND